MYWVDWTIPLKQLVSKIKTRKGLTLNITCFIDEKDSNVSFFFGKYCIVWLLRHISHPMQYCWVCVQTRPPKLMVVTCVGQYLKCCACNGHVTWFLQQPTCITTYVLVHASCNMHSSIWDMCVTGMQHACHTQVNDMLGACHAWYCRKLHM